MEQKRDYSKYFLPNLDRAQKRLKTARNLRHAFIIPAEIQNYGIGKKYCIYTYGCQGNVRDSETLAGIFEKLGYQKTTTHENADVVLLNTCAIRQNAEERVFGEIGWLKPWRLANPNRIFGMCGCMAQEREVVKRVLHKHPHVDLIFGTHNLHRLPQLLAEVRTARQVVIDVWSEEGDVIENLPVVRTSRVKAWVDITYGCDNFCTFCIVPYTRGKERSRQLQDVVQEVTALHAAGYQEVTLLGQNVNSYGLDLPGKELRFAELLAAVAKTGIPRVRFSTSNPWNFTPELVKTLASYSNIMPHVHLPMQSGSNAVLRRMGRRNTREDYLRIVSDLQARIPRLGLTTDIIIGFPEESAADFAATIDLYKQVRFDNAFTFLYSQREHTPAAKWTDSTPLEVKKSRLQKLNDLVRDCAKERSLAWVNEEVEVLVEGPSRKDETKLAGYSPQWKLVNFTGQAAPGQIVKVRVETASRFTLSGVQI